MKIIRLFTAIIFAIFTSVPFSFSATTEPAISSKAGSATKKGLVSMDFQDAELKTVLKAFSQQSGLNFIASQNVKDRTVTIYFDDVKVDEALNYIMNANNLVYEQEPGTNIFIVKESGKPEVETITKIYELKYAQLSMPKSSETGAAASGAAASVAEKNTNIVMIIQSMLSKTGKVIADSRSNSLIIKDVPSQFPIIEELLVRLDVRTQQVMIEVEVLEASTKQVENLGMYFSGTFGVYTGPKTNTIWPMNNRLGRNNASGEGISTAGSVSLTSTQATLYALLNSTDTKILARPKVLTMNNEMAKIELSSSEKTSVVNQSSSPSSGGGSITGNYYQESSTGVVLEVTPQISKDGYITMSLKPSVTELELSRFADAYDTHKRSSQTTVMVKDGETVVIGGLIKSNHSRGIRKVPFFGDIPVLGAAFRYKAKDDTDKELIIFITPKIVKDFSYALGNISEREQEKPKAVREKEIKTVLDLFGG